MQAQELLMLGRGWVGDDAQSLIIDLLTAGLKQLTFDAPEVFPICFRYTVHSLE